MASPSHQQVKTVLYAPSASSRDTPRATTSAFLHSTDSRHLRAMPPPSFSELSPPLPLSSVSPMPIPRFQTIPTGYEHQHKRRHVLMGPPAPPVPSPLRPATTYRGSDNGPPLPTPPSVSSPNGIPCFLASLPEDVKTKTGTHYSDCNEFTAAARFDYYLEPSVRLLAQNRLVDMGALRPGLYDGKVGLLPGLRGDFMENYEKPPKGRRAPREDLSPYTAEEKVERRKARAREYSIIARKRQEAIETAFKLDLGYMRSFRVIMEEGPLMVAVVAPDLEACVLYANGAFGRALKVPPKRLLRRSLWDLLHQADHLLVRNALISVVLSKNSPPSHVPCRVLAPEPEKYRHVQVSLAIGTQGVICAFWEA